MDLQRIPALMAVACVCLSAPAATAATRYVARGNPTPAAPYTNWTTAATNIQDAVDAAGSNDLILVTNGVYDAGGRAVYGTMANRVAIDKPVTVRSVNGPGVTIIRGQGPPGDGAVRCAYVGTNAMLAGFLLTNGGTRLVGDYDRERCGGGAWCEASGVLSNCTLAGNIASNAAGGAYHGTLNQCTLAGNVAAYYGGGAAACTLNNCRVSGNASGQQGGGAHGGTLNNCSLWGNTAGWSGGGASSAFLNNCTVAGNAAAYQGGGVMYGTLNNCIVYYNSAAYTPNHYEATFRYSCTTPLADGAGNFAGEPGLASFSHLGNGSPCVGAGNVAYASGTDLDGEPWGDPPSIGCDEFRLGTAAGDLRVAILAGSTNATAGFPVTFSALVDGQTWASAWSFIEGHVTISNRPVVEYAFAFPGVYDVVLRAFNRMYPDGVAATVRVTVAAAVIHYVRPANPSPAAPYTNWTTAATNIQDAIDAVWQVGAHVVVTNGVYDAGGRVVYGAMTNRVAIDKPVTVRSVNGPGVTAIRGQGPVGNGAVRCVYVGANATLAGFLLTNGSTRGEAGDPAKERYGGGAWCEPSGVLSNCVLAGNAANQCGGGVYQGTLNRCTLTGNWAGQQGGGAQASILNQCVVSDNTAGSSGGGTSGGTLNGCAIWGNSAGRSGGGAGGGTLNNCTVAGNAATDDGGGAWHGTLNNCIVYYNAARESPDCSETTLRFCCTTPPAEGTGILTNEPRLASLSHLALGSPCRGAGSAVYAPATDFDGEAWGLPPSIGCDELRAGAATGDLHVAIRADHTNVATGIPVTFSALVDGRTTASAWSFADGSAVASNRPIVAHAFASPGLYDVVLRAFNETHPGGVAATVRIVVAEAVVHYVCRSNAAPAAPYTNWATAATNIQDAIDAAWQAGAQVLVTNGVYDAGGRAVYGNLTNRVALNYIALRSVHGPSVTVIKGQSYPNGARVRCAYVGTNATLSGFLLTNGWTASTGDVSRGRCGGGAWCEASGVLTNCTLAGNRAEYYGGGVFDGMVLDGTLADNVAGSAGGGAYRGVLYRCTLQNNRVSDGEGGGAYDGRLFDSTLVGNVARWGGGVYYGTLTRCLFVGNLAVLEGGGAWDSALENCMLSSNSSYGDGGGAYGGVLNACILTHNEAWTNGGGAFGGTLSNCTLSGNWARGGGGACAGTLDHCTLEHNEAINGAGALYSGLIECDLSANTAWEEGGGAYEARLVDCTLTANVAVRGGGACASTLTHCTLTGNTAQRTGGGAQASGLTNCILAANSAWVGGGGICSSVLSRCTLSGNSTMTNGGGAYDSTLDACTLTGNWANAFGGGAYSGRLDNCTLVDNWANEDGGGACEAALTGCTLVSNLAYQGGGACSGALVQCTLSGNGAAWYGGGAFRCALTNCTLRGNSADYAGGGAFGGALNGCALSSNTGYRGGGVYLGALDNCTLAANAATAEGGGTLACAVTNCIVYFNAAPSAPNYLGGTMDHCCTTPLPAGGGHISGEPRFAGLATNNLRLLATSPCIDAGTNASWMVGSLDLDGHPRIANSLVDMGAYEYPGTGTPDSDGDGIPDEWESAHGLNPTVSNAPDANADSDPFTDGQEYLADTEPTNAASFFGPMWLFGGNPGLPWTSTGRTYALDAFANHVVPDWQTVTIFTGVGGPFVVPAAKTNNTGRFRARVWLPSP